MHQQLQSLWRSWVIVVAACVLALVLSTAWYAVRVGSEITTPELRQTTDVIGRSIAVEIERALAYQIPVRELVGVESWFADIVTANQVVDALALSDENGVLLAGYQVPAALKDTLRQRLTGRSDLIEDWHISTLPVYSGVESRVVGWLHVVGMAPNVANRTLLQALLAAITIIALMMVAIRRLLRQMLDKPLQRCRASLTAVTQGQLPDLATVDTRTYATSLQSELAQQLSRLREHSQKLMFKTGEVRAAHFDPKILQQIDDLTHPLVERQRQAHGHVPVYVAKLDRRMSLAQRLMLVGAGTLIVFVLVAGVFFQIQRATSERELVFASENTLMHAWQATLEQDRVLLDAQLQSLLTTDEVLKSIIWQDYETLTTTLARLAPDRLTFTLARLDGSVLATTSKLDNARPDRFTLSPLQSATLGIYGVWQDLGRNYRSGAARRVVGGNGEVLALLANQALEVSLAALERRIGVPVSLADLRGQPAFESSAALVKAWRAEGRSSYVGSLNGKHVVVGTLALTAASGHTLGTLLTALPQEHGITSDELGLSLVSVALAVMVTLAFLLYLAGALKPLGKNALRLSALADDQQQRDAPSMSIALHPHRMQRAIERIEEKIETFYALRRSRNRQGRRQARFIRHQMMQLAARLDDQARAAILQELETIESAGESSIDIAQNHTKRAAELDPRLERIVDEVGILALGFQNLVSRLGDQYQELDRLVGELREALRVKTQFIAIQQELDVARRMQLSILPHAFKSRDGLSLKATMLPAKEVGGDFYDFFALDAHRVALTIADVSGKGVPAALFMAVSRTLLRAVAQFSDTPARCMVRLNDLLAADNDEMMFVTLFYAVLDTRDGSLVYANAGHNPPYLLRQNGNIEAIASTGDMALAVMEGIDYTERQLVLGPGDGLFMYTDGVTEASGPGQVLFGEARLEDLLKTLLDTSVDEVPSQILAAIKTFEAGGPQADDITCLMARYQGHS